MTYFDEASERLARVDALISQNVLDPELAERRRRSRRRLVLASLTTAAASFGVAAGMPSFGGRDHVGQGRLALMQTPRASAAEVSEVIDAHAAGVLDVRNAHPFGTPNGRGYLIPRRDGKQLCVAIPDRPDGYGMTCQWRRSVERRGMPIRLVSSGLPTSGPSITAVVLPAGVTEATVRSADGERTVEARHGVVVVEVEQEGALSWATARGSESIALHAVHRPGR